MSPTVHSTEVTIWNTPAGVVELCEGGAIRVTIHDQGGNGAHGTLPQPAMNRLGDGFLLDFSEKALGAEGRAFEVTAQGVKRIPLPSLVLAWRRSSASHLPQVLQLANSLARACREMDQLRTARFLLSPAQVFWCVAEDREHWELVPLPLLSPTMEEFAASSPDALAWLTPDAVLGTGGFDWARMVSVALYYCLAGEVFPRDLPQNERLKRLLQNRAGNQARLRSAITLALPKTLAGQGAEFSKFLWSLLSPSHTDSMNPAQVSRRFGEFLDEFSALRLAGAWEMEHNPHLALDILNLFARSSRPEEVPWQTLARLHALTGDADGAAEIKARHPEAGEAERVSLIARLRDLAAKGEEGREELEAQVARIRPGQPARQASHNAASPSSAPPGDEEFLYLAYVDGRWLGKVGEALQLLERDFSISWYRVVREVLAARLNAEQPSWPKVSWHCRAGRSVIEKLPDQGGTNGRYAAGYLDLLDGIAHMKAVEGGLGAAYLADSLVKLQSAWVNLHKVSPERKDASLGGWLATLTQRMKERPELALMAISAEAFCQAEGIALSGETANRQLPWFSEEFLFNQ